MLCQDDRFIGFGDTYLIPGINSELDLCNCGDSLATCHFRTRLAEQLQSRGLPTGMILNSRYRMPISTISSRFEGTRFLPLYQTLGRTIGYSNAFSSFLKRESGYLNSIGELGNFNYFLDGTKNLVRADIFTKTNKHNQIIHLIRDPIAAIHSAATRHNTRGKSARFNVRSWITYNTSAQKLCNENLDRSATIFFDDMVNNPDIVLKTLALKLDWGSLDVNPDNLTPEKTHLLGNRSRHNATEVRAKQLKPTPQDLRNVGVPDDEIEKLINVYTDLKQACLTKIQF